MHGVEAMRSGALVSVLVAFALAQIVAPHLALAQPRNQASAAGQVDGTISNALGQPIPDATISLSALDGRVTALTHTDAHGRFNFRSVHPGTYQITASKLDFKPEAQTLRLSERQRAARLMLTMEAKAPLTLAVVAHRLDNARNALSPATGGSVYKFDQAAIGELPEGANTALSQMLVQAPGVSQDGYGQGQEQIHVHGENGGGLQYRVNGIFLPEAVSSYGEILSPRFVRSLTLLTGVMPAQIGYRNEGVIDVQTKDGCADGGPHNNNVDFFGGQRATFEPSFEYGGCAGRFSYYTSGFYLQSALGLQPPTSRPDPKHDQTYQGQGLANLNYFINSQTRLSLLAGTAVNYFQIPPESNLAPVYTLSGVSSYPSADIHDSETEQSYYGILSLQGTIGAAIDYQLAAFSRYYTLTFDPDPIGDLIFNGVAARIRHTGFINGLQEDTAYRLDATNTLRAGLYLSGEAIEIDDDARTFPAKDGVQTSSTPVSIINDNNQVAWVLGLYAQDEWRPLPHLTVNFGARWDRVSAFVTQNQLSPRLGFEYEVVLGTSLYGGYARYLKLPPFESVALETVKTFENTTNAAPVSSGNDKVSAERDDYFDLGIRQGLLQGLKLDVDGFLKFGHDQLDLAQLAGSQVFAPLQYRKSRAWGADCSLTYQQDAVSGYVNFSYAVLQARDISAAQFLADSAQEIAYVANHWIPLDDNQLFTGSTGASYRLWGFLLTADAIWGSGYRRGLANSGELPPSLQVNAAIVRSMELSRFGEVEGRLSVINLFDHSYEIRNGTGIGVFSPQYGPRRAVYAGLKVPLATLMNASAEVFGAKSAKP